MQGNILCVGNWESDVGYAWWLMERFWEGIAKRYPNRTIVSFKKLNTVSERLKSSGARFTQLEPTNLIEFVRENSVKHLYLTDQAYYSADYVKLRAAGIKSIIVHDHTPGDRTIPAGVKRFLKTVAARLPWTADAYIAVSEPVLNRFRDVVRLPKRKCHLAVNGIDLNLQIEPTDIRAELELPKDAIVIASSSRATKYKQIHHIIEAAQKVPGAYFIHCGDGPDLNFFASEIESRGLGSRFFLLGRRKDVPGLLAASDIAVHASVGEAASLSILEFMRAGLPILLPNSPTVCQSVTENISALLYQPGNIQQMSEKLSLLVANSALRKSLGNAAKEQVKRYNIENTVNEVLNVFSALQI